MNEIHEKAIRVTQHVPGRGETASAALFIVRITGTELARVKWSDARDIVEYPTLHVVSDRRRRENRPPTDLLSILPDVSVIFARGAWLGGGSPRQAQIAVTGEARIAARCDVVGLPTARIVRAVYAFMVGSATYRGRE